MSTRSRRELVEEFVSTFEQKLAELQRNASSERLRASKELDRVSRRLEGVPRAIKNGVRNPNTQGRTRPYWSRAKPSWPTCLLTRTPLRHPGRTRVPPRFYRQTVANLEASLNAPDIRTEAIAILRQPFDMVVRWW